MAFAKSTWLDLAEVRHASRLTTWLPSDRVAVADYALALVAGLTAACAVALIDLAIRVPRHAILKATLPIAAGFALAPRRFAGGAMATGAIGGLWGLNALFGLGIGMGATTSLVVLGPLMELMFWGSRAGWPLYLRLAGAGVLANLCAFAIRGGGKATGFDALKMRSLDSWLTVAPWTYPICGLATCRST